MLSPRLQSFSQVSQPEDKKGPLKTKIRPTWHGNARPLHVLVGRIGMVASIVAFVLEAVCAWWPTRDRPPPTFSIGITIGGRIQVLYQGGSFLFVLLFSHFEVKTMMRLKTVLCFALCTLVRRYHYIHERYMYHMYQEERPVIQVDELVADDRDDITINSLLTGNATNTRRSRFSQGPVEPGFLEDL